MTGEAAKSVPQATVDIGRVFVEGGFFGLVIYAILLAFFLLLVRDVLKDWAIRQGQRETAKAMTELAAAVANMESRMIAQLSLIPAFQNLAAWQRARDKNQLPGAIDGKEQNNAP